MPKPKPPATSAGVDNVEKTVEKTERTQPGLNGGTLKVGNPGNSGGGRPSDAWKAKCAQLADKWAKAAEAEQVLDKPDHPFWLGAGKFVAEQAHGRAAQPITGDPDRPFEITVRRERKRTTTEAPEE